MMQVNACLSVCLAVCLARVSIYMFPVCGGPIRVRGDVLCRLPTADSDGPLSRWKKKKGWTALEPPPGGERVCAFLPLNLRTCVRPLIMGPVDMLHLRRRKTPLCPAPLSGVGVVVGRLGTAASQTLVRGLILSAQGQKWSRWLNSSGSFRGDRGRKLQWMSF